MTSCRTKNASFSSEHVIQIRESTSRVRFCESLSHPVFNHFSGGYSFASYAIAATFIFSRCNIMGEKLLPSFGPKILALIYYFTCDVPRFSLPRWRLISFKML